MFRSHGSVLSYAPLVSYPTYIIVDMLGIIFIILSSRSKRYFSVVMHTTYLVFHSLFYRKDPFTEERLSVRSLEHSANIGVFAVHMTKT